MTRRVGTTCDIRLYEFRIEIYRIRPKGEYFQTLKRNCTGSEIGKPRVRNVRSSLEELSRRPAFCRPVERTVREDETWANAVRFRRKRFTRRYRISRAEEPWARTAAHSARVWTRRVTDAACAFATPAVVTICKPYRHDFRKTHRAGAVGSERVPRVTRLLIYGFGEWRRTRAAERCREVERLARE